MPQSHYINKLKFTVAAPHSADVFALQSAVSQRIKQSVVPAVSVVFDRFADVDEVIKIDRLDIDLTHIPFSRWETEITPSVCRAIEAELARILLDVPTIAHILKGIKVAKQSVVQSQFEAWLYFLETGQLPKTASFEAGWRHAALDSVAANIRDVEILRGLLLRKSVVVERLVLQHDEPFLLTLAEAMTGRNQSELRSFRQTFEAVLTADTFIRELKKLATSSIEFTSLAARDIEILFWKKVFEDLANGSQMIDFQLFISRFLGLYLQQILKKDYVLFLKSIVFWAKPKRQKIKKAKGTNYKITYQWKVDVANDFAVMPLVYYADGKTNLLSFAADKTNIKKARNKYTTTIQINDFSSFKIATDKEYINLKK